MGGLGAHFFRAWGCERQKGDLAVSLRKKADALNASGFVSTVLKMACRGGGGGSC